MNTNNVNLMHHLLWHYVHCFSASPTGTDFWQLRGEGLISQVWVLVMFVHADQPLSIPDLRISCSIAVLIQRHLTSLPAKIWWSFNVKLQISQFLFKPTHLFPPQNWSYCFAFHSLSSSVELGTDIFWMSKLSNNNHCGTFSFPEQI